MNERTSATVARHAARVLNPNSIAHAEDWLANVQQGHRGTKATAARYAMQLRSFIESARIVAGSALTQHPDRQRSKRKVPK